MFMYICMKTICIYDVINGQSQTNKSGMYHTNSLFLLYTLDKVRNERCFFNETDTVRFPHIIIIY